MASATAVLISEPQSWKREPFFPYLWSVLKSYCDHTGHLGDAVQWLEPVYQKNDPEVLLAPYRDTPPDVLGLSCYTWNWDLQCRLAQQVKQRHPRCLVVAGGPHPDYKDPQFFDKYPFIDLVAVKDGEITFSKILAHVAEGNHDFRDIAGLYFPGPRGAESMNTGPAEVPTVFEYSPYIMQSAYFEALSTHHGPSHFSVIWETNRGCPYSCNFCDWGSNTMSKIRRFDIERVKAEIAWFARMQIKGILLTDANFGILPRDLEIADWLNDARATHGYPRFMHYSPAKNNPERTVEIAKKFVASGISPVHTFAIQHADVGVLAAADRANISVEKQRQVAKAVVTNNIPTLVQLILGIPGDTYDLWKTCLTDLMDWGLHDNYQIFNYTLLPNAPAADKAFRAEWEVQTISRYIPKEGIGQRHGEDTDGLTSVDIIVQSKTFSRDDWVKMKIYSAFIRALHNRSLTRLIALYLHFGHGVSYREFYTQLIEGYFGPTHLYHRLYDHFHRFLTVAEASEDLEFEQFADTPLYAEASGWLFVQICWDFEHYFDGIKTFLLERFPQATNLPSAIDYQRNVVILPSHDVEVGKAFQTDFDWIGYFARASLLTNYEALGEPERVSGGLVEVLDKSRDLAWSSQDENGRWRSWMARTRELQRTLRTNFQELKLHRAVA